MKGDVANDRHLIYIASHVVVVLGLRAGGYNREGELAREPEIGAEAAAGEDARPPEKR